MLVKVSTHTAFVAGFAIAVDGCVECLAALISLSSLDRLSSRFYVRLALPIACDMMFAEFNIKGWNCSSGWALYWRCIRSEHWIYHSNFGLECLQIFLSAYSQAMPIFPDSGHSSATIVPRDRHLITTLKRDEWGNFVFTFLTGNVKGDDLSCCEAMYWKASFFDG